MTSSLVGSEMCIRDSEDSGFNSSCKASIATFVCAWVSLQHGNRPEPVSVSYTHLTLPTICSV
eukprot:10681467-Prorocentrum_lima.AAC.1